MSLRKCAECGMTLTTYEAGLCDSCAEKYKERSETERNREEARRERQSKPGGYTLGDLFRDWFGK